MHITAILDAFAEKRKTFEQELKAIALKTIGEGLHEFMVIHPEIDQLRWQQYTPYFNDGDECVFSVNDLYVHVSTTTPENGEIPDCDYGYGKGWSNSSKRSLMAKGLTECTADAILGLEAALQRAPEELKSAFGDHVEIIVNRDGISVDEYEHD